MERRREKSKIKMKLEGKKDAYLSDFRDINAYTYKWKGRNYKAKEK